MIAARWTRMPGRRARTRADAALAFILLAALAASSVVWHLPARLSGHPWRSDIGSIVGHLLIVAAGALPLLAVLALRRTRELERAVRHHQHLALHDPLTQLPNRLLLTDRLHHAVARAHRTRELVGVLMFDLNDFKAVNDLHGHLTGDMLLRQVAHRLAAAVRESDTVARVGGDEFIALVTATDIAGIRQAAARLAARFEEPFHVDGSTLRVTASVGLAVPDGDSVSAEELLHRADMAMYEAERSSRGT